MNKIFKTVWLTAIGFGIAWCSFLVWVLIDTSPAVIPFAVALTMFSVIFFAVLFEKKLGCKFGFHAHPTGKYFAWPYSCKLCGAWVDLGRE